MEDDLPSAGLSRDLLIAIGCLVVQWGSLESTLNSHLRILLAQPVAAEYRPDNRRLAFAKRLDLYRKLASVFYHGKALKAAELACRMISEVKDEREWLAHGAISQLHDGQLFAVRVDDAMTEPRTDEDRPVDIEFILQAARVMEAARLEMVRAYSSVMRDLRPDA